MPIYFDAADLVEISFSVTEESLVAVQYEPDFVLRRLRPVDFEKVADLERALRCGMSRAEQARMGTYGSRGLSFAEDVARAIVASRVCEDEVNACIRCLQENRQYTFTMFYDAMTRSYRMRFVFEPRIPASEPSAPAVSDGSITQAMRSSTIEPKPKLQTIAATHRKPLSEGHIGPRRMFLKRDK